MEKPYLFGVSLYRLPMYSSVKMSLAPLFNLWFKTTFATNTVPGKREYPWLLYYCVFTIFLMTSDEFMPADFQFLNADYLSNLSYNSRIKP